MSVHVDVNFIFCSCQVSEKFSTQIGPKSFNIDRLMAIFYAINVNKVPVTSDLMMQISNLVRLKYLAFVSGESNIMDGSARLQCNVTLNFISMVCHCIQGHFEKKF